MNDEGIIVHDADSSWGITVHGVGTAAVRPNVLSARLGAEVSSSSVQGALQQCSQAMKDIVAAFRQAGIDDGDLVTTGADVSNAYGQRGESNGWRATQELTVTLREVETAGDIIANAVGVSGSAGRIHNLSLTADDTAAADHAARKAAFADAKLKAEQYAELAGRELGRVAMLREEHSRSGGGIRLMSAGGAGAAGPTMPVEAGNLYVNATIEVRWTLIS